MTKQKAIIELIFAGAIWGLGFTATQWALVAFSPAVLMSVRMLLAAFFGMCLCLFFEFFPNKKGFTHEAMGLLLPGLISGLALGGVLLTQTMGLQYTSATNSGFITCLYVVLVPLVGTVILRHVQAFRIWMAVGTAFLGTYVLMGAKLSELNKGDLWTLLCAVLSTFHILYLGEVAHRIHRPWFFNAFQNFVAGIFCLFFVPEFRMGALTFSVWGGILILSLGCSALAFAVQVRTQKIISPTIVSLLFLLESPFAMFFDVVLQEKLPNIFQIVGAGLIMIAAVIAISSPSRDQVDRLS